MSFILSTCYFPDEVRHQRGILYMDRDVHALRIKRILTSVNNMFAIKYKLTFLGGATRCNH